MKHNMDISDLTPEGLAKWLDMEIRALGPSGGNYSEEPVSVYMACRYAIRFLEEQIELRDEVEAARNRK